MGWTHDGQVLSVSTIIITFHNTLHAHANNNANMIQLQIVEQVGWTHDGQVLSVSTTSGEIYSYLSTLPIVSDFYSSQVSD